MASQVQSNQPVRSRQQRLREILRSPDTYATTLVTVFIDRYGTDGLSWAPETIKLQMAEDFGVELPPLAFDKLMAAITLLTTNYFYKNLHKFMDLCNVLSGTAFNPNVLDLADSSECAWGITEALLISPPEEAEPFSDDIRHYIGAVLANEGFVTPPDVLRIALGGDAVEQVHNEFADDPTMFSAIWQNQQSKTQDLNTALRAGLTELFQQLQALPLESGNAAELLKRLPEHLKVGA